MARVSQTRLLPKGSVIFLQGDNAKELYILKDNDYQLLEVLNPGDFFGEIAALTGAARTANVVTEQDSTLLQVPATALRQLTGQAVLNRLFMNKMTERMVRMKMIDAPRLAGLDQAVLRELCTETLQASQA